MESALKRGCTIRIENFEGPLDLLYHLIEKNQMNIYDIKINEITDQYMDYLFKMQTMDLEIASEFLVMAATLLHIKSRLLLPQIKKDVVEEDSGLDPEEELVLKLIQYKKYKEFTGTLKGREEEWAGVFYKDSEKLKFKWDEIPLELDPDKLKSSYLNMIEKNEQKRNAFLPQKMSAIIEHEKVSLRGKIRQVIKALITKTKICFSDIFSLKTNSKLEVVTGFMAILELAKVKKVEVHQEKQFGDIMLTRRAKGIELEEISNNEFSGD